jgi:hypothetical protein
MICFVQIVDVSQPCIVKVESMGVFISAILLTGEQGQNGGLGCFDSGACM